MITFKDFEKIDIRTGKILTAEKIENSRYSTHRLTVDFGQEKGIKKSCARLVNYKLEDLPGKLILGVLNFPPKQIGKHMSEVLILGVPDEQEECILVEPERPVSPGVKLY